MRSPSTFSATRAPNPGGSGLDEAIGAHLEAVQASVEAGRAFAGAAPMDRRRAFESLLDATRRQTAAERAYERARQQAYGAPFAGRPRYARPIDDAGRPARRHA